MAEQLERYGKVTAAEECEDTVELELSEEQLLRLTRASTATQSSSLPDLFRARSVWKSTENEPGGWRAIAIYLLGASALSGLIAYIATIPAQPIMAPPLTAQPIIVGSGAVARSVAAETVTQPVVESPAVRFTNPFDTTEVFEFPPGTSDSEARQAAADLLLQRARDRETLWSKIVYQGRKAPVRGAVVATKLAQRG